LKDSGSQEPLRIGQGKSGHAKKEKTTNGEEKKQGGVESSDLWDSDVWTSTLTGHTPII
jgi:hypothetical protein